MEEDEGRGLTRGREGDDTGMGVDGEFGGGEWDIGGLVGVVGMGEDEVGLRGEVGPVGVRVGGFCGKVGFIDGIILEWA